MRDRQQDQWWHRCDRGRNCARHVIIGVDILVSDTTRGGSHGRTRINELPQSGGIDRMRPVRRHRDCPVRDQLAPDLTLGRRCDDIPAGVAEVDTGPRGLPRWLPMVRIERVVEMPATRRRLHRGEPPILIAASTENAVELNQRARADLIHASQLKLGTEVRLGNDSAASVGDTVITRHNNLRLRNGAEWVRNGERWLITAVHHDRSVTVRHIGRRTGGIRLPASYIAEHLELGYAVTAFRAQGITTDTSHVVISPTNTRESLYVAMTRGRLSNAAYVATDRPDDAYTIRHPADPPDLTARTILLGVLNNVGAELSAHQTINAEQDAWTSIAQLAAEYETIAAAAQHHRWTKLIKASGLPPALSEAAINSPAFGPLTAQLRRAEAHHHNVDTLLPRLVAARGFADADDIAAVLHARLVRAAGSGRTHGDSNLIAGLIPAATGPMTADEMRHTLDERRDLIERRADALLDAAIDSDATWLRTLGQPPTNPASLDEWRRHAHRRRRYRDRDQVNPDDPLGVMTGSYAQQLDAKYARQAIQFAQRATAEPTTPEAPIIAQPRGEARVL